MSQSELPLRKVFPGETIFTEGAVGARHMYIIREGTVEISITRDQKKIVLNLYGRGAFFGEMALISGGPRSATAKAQTYCELHVVDSKALENTISGSHPIVRHMLKSMVALIKSQNVLASKHSLGQPTIIAYAHLIEMLSPDPVSNRLERKSATAKIAQQELIDKARILFGDSKQAVIATLRYMESLDLLKVNPEARDEPRALEVDPKTIVERARKLPGAIGNAINESIQSEQELIDLAEFQALVEVDRSILLRKLAHQEFADDIFAFRKSAILKLYQEKGRAHFASMQPGTAQHFDSLRDLSMVPKRLLFDAVNSIDVYDLAKLARAAQDAGMRETMLSVMTQSKRDEVEDLGDMIGSLDPVEVAHIEQRLTDAIKRRLAA